MHRSSGTFSNVLALNFNLNSSTTPDLMPCSLHFFPQKTQDMEGSCSEEKNTVKIVVKQWTKDKHFEFLFDGITFYVGRGELYGKI